jgi:hypothetical protein
MSGLGAGYVREMLLEFSLEAGYAWLSWKSLRGRTCLAWGAGYVWPDRSFKW